MEHQTAGIRVTAAEEGDHVVDAAYSKEHHMLALRRKERTEQGIFVEFELRLAMSRGEPRGPGPDQGKPSVLGQHWTASHEQRASKAIIGFPIWITLT
jgi:hypothetical protein